MHAADCYLARDIISERDTSIMPIRRVSNTAYLFTAVFTYATHHCRRVSAPILCAEREARAGADGRFALLSRTAYVGGSFFSDAHCLA